MVHGVTDGGSAQNLQIYQRLSYSGQTFLHFFALINSCAMYEFEWRRSKRKIIKEGHQYFMHPPPLWPVIISNSAFSLIHHIEAFSPKLILSEVKIGKKCLGCNRGGNITDLLGYKGGGKFFFFLRNGSRCMALI